MKYGSRKPRVPTGAAGQRVKRNPLQRVLAANRKKIKQLGRGR